MNFLFMLIIAGLCAGVAGMVNALMLKGVSKRIQLIVLVFNLLIGIVIGDISCYLSYHELTQTITSAKIIP